MTKIEMGKQYRTPDTSTAAVEAALADLDDSDCFGNPCDPMCFGCKKRKRAAELFRALAAERDELKTAQHNVHSNVDWLQKLLADARRSALEEAAQLIESTNETTAGHIRYLSSRLDGSLTGLEYAKAIRALAEKEG